MSVLLVLSWMSGCSRPAREVVWVGPDEAPFLVLGADGVMKYPYGSLDVGIVEDGALHVALSPPLSVATTGDDPGVVVRPDGGIQLKYGGAAVSPAGQVLVDGLPFGEMRPGSPLDERHAALLLGWTALRPPLGVIASLWTFNGGSEFGVRALPDGRVVEPDDEICPPGPECRPTFHVIGTWTEDAVTVEGRTRVIADTVMPHEGGCRVQVGIRSLDFDGDRATYEKRSHWDPTASVFGLGHSLPSCEDPVTRAALAGLAARMVTIDHPSPTGRGLEFYRPLPASRSSQATYEAASRRLRRRLMECGLPDPDQPAAIVRVTLTLNEQGRLSHPPLVTSTNGSPALDACVAQVLSAMDAGPGNEGEAALTIRFESGRPLTRNAWPTSLGPSLGPSP